MKGGVRFYLVGAGLLLALAGCGRGLLQYGERPSWRHQAEVACLKSGAVKIGAGVVQIQPIDGPGMCGADFPLKVAALGESSAIGYADDPRPPGAIPHASSAQMPRWPPSAPSYARPVQTQPAQGQQMRWTPGPPGIEPPRHVPASAPPQSTVPAGRPMSIYAPGMAQPDDIPDDAILPPGRGTISYPRTQPAYNTPSYEPPRQPRALPALGPVRGPRATGSIIPAAVTPPATLACPLVSALDRWVSEGVQPAALRWFGTQVTEIKQISAYSCRGMVGAGTSRISEHAFGNALDVAGFTLADGRKVSVKDGWRGSPEEQGFLRDVQLYACDTFTTVLAPGYNAAHYNHIHVDLMQRESGRRPCRPNAIPGEVAAAKARAVYASKQRGPDYTGSVTPPRTKALVSIGAMIRALPEALPGEDGYVADDESDDQNDAVTGSIPEPVAQPKKGGTFGDAIARWFGRSSVPGRQNAAPDMDRNANLY